MHFLVVDGRYGTPVYAFLEADPRAEGGFPGLSVREVALELADAVAGVGPRMSLGADPGRRDRFREFRTDGAVARAGFVLIEPRYVGPTWEEYVTEFRPQGEPLFKRPGRARGSPAGR